MIRSASILKRVMPLRSEGTLRRMRSPLGLVVTFGFGLVTMGSAMPAIEWDSSTLRLVAKGGGYARIIRLQSGDLLCSYERKRQSCLKRSRDNGVSWGEELVVTSCRHGTAANPELIELEGGRLLLLYNERPDRDEHPYTISLVSSGDGGASSPIQSIID